MEKYGRLSKITTQYLNGHLAKLKFNYEDENTLSLSLVYEDDYHYWFDYELNISIPKKSIEYAKHCSEGYMNKVELDRESDFEQAVFNEIFAN